MNSHSSQKFIVNDVFTTKLYKSVPGPTEYLAAIIAKAGPQKRNMSKTPMRFFF